MRGVRYPRRAYRFRSRVLGALKAALFACTCAYRRVLGAPATSSSHMVASISPLPTWQRLLRASPVLGSLGDALGADIRILRAQGRVLDTYRTSLRGSRVLPVSSGAWLFFWRAWPRPRRTSTRMTASFGSRTTPRPGCNRHQSPSIGSLQSIESIESFHSHLSQPSIHPSYLQPYPTHPAPPRCVSFFSLSFHRFALWRLTIFPSSCYAALRVYCLQVLAKPTPTGGVQILAELVPVVPRRDFTRF